MNPFEDHEIDLINEGLEMLISQRASLASFKAAVLDCPDITDQLRDKGVDLERLTKDARESERSALLMKERVILLLAKLIRLKQELAAERLGSE